MPRQCAFLVIVSRAPREHAVECPFPTQEDRMLTCSRRHRVSLVCGVTAVACAASTLLSQPGRPPDTLQDKLVFAPVRASDVMSAVDRQRTGVDRLTPEQRFALDTW